MAIRTIFPSKKLKGRPNIPGDKSISHRSLIFGALAAGQTEILHLLNSEDVMSTARCLRQLGVEISQTNDRTIVNGRGGYNFIQPKETLDCGNSGTTIRLLMGVLAGQKMTVTLTGDDSLRQRPMRRVSEPLSLMGGQFELTNENFAPMKIIGQSLKGVNYELKIASAQIKTAIILAALNAEGKTLVSSKIQSRDHTERMLAHFGVHIEVEGEKILIQGGQKLKANSIRVPGDPSTAAFWIGAAALIAGSDVEMSHVSLNPSRTGFLEALRRMGANIESKLTENNPEPLGTVKPNYGKLKPIHIREADVPALIDEIPLLAVLATQAHGRTIVEGAEELRVKETDRLEAVAHNLRAMGARIEVRPDGFVIDGPQALKGATIESFHDHRIAMAFSIAALIAEGETKILNSECVGISYPEFYETLSELTR